MRFNRLAVPAFGPFTEFALECPTGGSDFHLIYGPNEAGKSSLLRAIRDLLYGIHGQTPDNFLHDYKDLRIAGTIVNSADQRLSFQRRKGNKRTLLDETGNILPDETLDKFLGAVDRDFFTTIFGLGSEELREGADALLHGQGELGEALFSASLAGTPVHRILDSLDAEARTLFDGRARTKVNIRPAVDAYEESLRQSKAAIVRPEAWEDTLNALADAKNAREGFDTALKEQRMRRDWLQRCLDSLPVLGQLSEQEQQLASLPAIPIIGVEFVTTTEQAFTGRDQAQTTLNQLNLRIEQLETRVQENQPSDKVLARAAEIETAHLQLAVYRQWKTEQVGLEADLDRAESELLARMRELGVTGEPAVVESLRIQAADELALREAASFLDTAAEQLQANHNEMARINRDLEKVTNRLSALPTADVSALRSALIQTVGAAEASKGISKQQSGLKGAFRKVEIQHGLLGGIPADHWGTFDLPVPAAATLRQFEAELTQIDVARARVEDSISEIDVKLRHIGGQLERLERRGTLPTIAALHEAREHRDQGWDRVLAAWKDGKEEGELDGQPLAVGYPMTVREADAIADRLREDAETVTQAEELRIQSREAETAKADAQTELEEVKASQADWKQRWNEAWFPCEITPTTPAEMLEWRDEWVKFRTLYEVWEKAREELSTAQEEIKAAVKILSPLLSSSGDQSLPVLRGEVEREVQEADEAKGARMTLQTQETDYKSDLQKHITAQPELTETKELALTAWQTQCGALSLPVEASTSTCLALLDQRKQVIGKFDVWTSLQQATEVKREAISDYEASVHALADDMALVKGVVEVRESVLWNVLEEARTQKTRQIQAQSDLEQEVEQLPHVQQILSEAEREVADFVILSGAADEVELKKLLVNLKSQQAINAEIEHLHQALHVTARGEPLDIFIERVRAEPGDSLTAERDGLDQAILNLEAERDEAIQKLAMAEEQKHNLEQSGAEASEFLQTARNIAVQIRHDASRYLRLQFAMHFLREQIEQFRRENQGPMLARAGELFHTITEASFEGLGTAFAEDDTPVLVGVRNGTEVGVQGMSDGTRDQLYLALRLAAIERHQEHHEPMPLILDDVLASFDDQRVRAILPLLRDLGKKTQIMLFTHHQHLVELAREVLEEDGLHVHELSVSDSD